MANGSSRPGAIGEERSPAARVRARGLLRQHGELLADLMIAEALIDTFLAARRDELGERYIAFLADQVVDLLDEAKRDILERLPDEAEVREDFAERAADERFEMEVAG